MSLNKIYSLQNQIPSFYFSSSQVVDAFLSREYFLLLETNPYQRHQSLTLCIFVCSVCFQSFLTTLHFCLQNFLTFLKVLLFLSFSTNPLLKTLPD